MGFDFQEFLKQREQKGIYVSYSVDIRTVEGFLGKLFGKKKDDSDETEEKDDGGQKSDSR